MAERKALVIIDGVVQQLPDGDTLYGAGTVTKSTISTDNELLSISVHISVDNPNLDKNVIVLSKETTVETKSFNSFYTGNIESTSLASVLPSIKAKDFVTLTYTHYTTATNGINVIIPDNFVTDGVYKFIKFEFV